MKTILITGSTDGIGRETAKQIAEKGHRIIIHGRSEEKAEKLKKELNKINAEAEHKIAIADLEFQQAVFNLAKELQEKEQKIDVLINNAGVYQNSLELTNDQIEKTIAVNYYSHFILTLMLIPLLEKSDDPRIINFSSRVHSQNLDPEKIWKPADFNSSQAYADSKLAAILFTYKLDRILDKIKVNCLHPGVVNTKLLKKGWNVDGFTVEQGAKTPVYLALSDEVKGESGHYFVNNKKKKAADAASRAELQDQLWNKSIEMIKYKEIINEIPARFLK